MGDFMAGFSDILNKFSPQITQINADYIFKLN